MRNRRQLLRPILEQLDDRCLLSTSGPTLPSGLTPSQISTAYGLNALTFTTLSGSTVKADGSGETIALIELNSDPDIQSDLNTFDETYNLPTPTLTVVNQAGSQTDSNWSIEQALDVEWAHAVAPGANILLVEAAPSGSEAQELQNLLNAVNTARNTPGVVAISMSWGFNEMANESQYDWYFTTSSGHTGITFVAASGDTGTVEYPSASPFVLSVGGTTLSLGNSGTYGSESAWSESGGGYSQYEPEPAYQQSVQRTGRRSTPDVAFDADPSTGVAVYSTDPGSGQGSWQVVGGTSLGAPAWAGIIAIVDQGRAVAGKASLDGATQTLPSIYAAPSTAFNTVDGSSTSSPSGGGFSEQKYNPFAAGVGVVGSASATTGATANTLTGLGSPLGFALTNDLVASTLTRPLTITESSSSVTVSAPTRSAQHHTEHRKTRTHAISRQETRSSTRHQRRLVTQGKSNKAKKAAVDPSKQV